MKPVREVRGIAAPLLRDDVDTDQIIPKQFLKRVERTGYGAFLFHDWRYAADGTPNQDFVLNRPPWNRARVLVAGENFGCGSSREHAVWALADFGFGAVIAPSFADIFRSNCFQSGMVPVQLSPDEVHRLTSQLMSRPTSPQTSPPTSRDDSPTGLEVTIDVIHGTVRADGFEAVFQLDPFRKRCLIEGLDDIGLTLEHEQEILEYEQRQAGSPVGDG